MLITCAAAARLLFYKEQRIWPAVAMPALLVALALTLTQNAWIGTVVALGCLVAIRQAKLLLLAPLVLGLAFLIAPSAITMSITVIASRPRANHATTGTIRKRRSCFESTKLSRG